MSRSSRAIGVQLEFTWGDFNRTMKFSGDKYDQDILIDPGDFAVIRFRAEGDAVIEISAWEEDQEEFDLFLLRKEDVFESSFRGEQSLVHWDHETDHRSQFAFPRSGEYCIVLSNTYAISRPKMIRVSLQWIHKKSAAASSDETSKQQESDRQWRTVLKVTAFIVIILLPLLIGVIVWILSGDIITLTIAVAVQGMIGILVGLFREEIKKHMGF